MDPWDALSDLFAAGEDAVAADNVLIAWPEMLAAVERQMGAGRGREALDFGCGAGGLALALHERGFRVTGLDRSRAMIEAARARLPASVALTCAPPETLGDTRVALVTSCMVLQFVEPIGETLAALDRLLAPGGMLLFAVFDPAFVTHVVASGSRIFPELDLASRRGTMSLTDGSEVPLYLRTADEYGELLAPLGYREVARSRPPFTAEFVARYPLPFPADVPEYLIVGYEKTRARPFAA